jgi:DNA ligase 4
VSFDTLCNFLDNITAIMSSKEMKNKFQRRRQAIQYFLDEVVDRTSGEAFDIFRLILPSLDTERGNYQLKEQSLGSVFVDALGMEKTNEQARALLDWKNPAIQGGGAGDLSAIVERIVTKHAGFRNDAPEEERRTLKIATINAKLDEMVRAAGSRQEQANILTYLIRRATPRQLKWLTQIILKNMKHGCGERVFFNVWHPDAQAYYDSHGMSLRAVFNDLKDRYRPVTVDIIPGKVVNPQLASTTYSASLAIQKLRLYEKERLGGDAAATAMAAMEKLSFLIETKFDGERIQVHRVGNTIQYFSRNAIEHGQKSSYTLLDDAIIAATGGRVSEEELAAGAAAGKKKGGGSGGGPGCSFEFDCVLDGELIVWNKRR